MALAFLPPDIVMNTFEELLDQYTQEQPSVCAHNDFRGVILILAQNYFI